LPVGYNYFSFKLTDNFICLGKYQKELEVEWVLLIIRRLMVGMC
jgi:hypothetical protein